jgi:hypothetical protein
MNEFVYLYRSPPSPSLSPQQMQDRIQRWSVWFRDLEKKGALANRGLPLLHTGGGVVRDKAGTVSDGPFAETKDIVVGFSVVQAPSLEEAVALATACPMFDQGGVIEVRLIAKL